VLLVEQTERACLAGGADLAEALKTLDEQLGAPLSASNPLRTVLGV